MTNRPKSIPVYLDDKTYERVRKFAYLQKTSMSKVMLNAFQDWIKLTTQGNLK